MKGRRAIFLAMWILSLVGISFFGGTISYGLFWGLTMIPVLSALYLLFVYSQFRIYQEIGSRTIVTKQPMPFYLVLKNETKCTFTSLKVKMFARFSQVSDMLKEQEYQLLPDEKHSFEAKLICYYRGEYEVGVEEIEITDFLRLFKVRYKNPGTIKALVYPRILHLDRINGLLDDIIHSSLEYPYERTQMDVVTRDYLPGDRINQIHFKASAKEMKLKTRNQTGERRQQMLLLFDAKRYYTKEEMFLPLENQILETVIAIGEFLASQKLPFTAFYEQGQMKKVPVEGLTQFDYFYEEIARVSFGESFSIQGLVTHLWNQGQIAWDGHTCILVAHQVEKETLKFLYEKCELGLTIVLYLVTNQKEEQISQFESSRFKIVTIPVMEKLEEVL